MARSAEGWKLIWRRGIACVRFRHEGHRHEISTRTRDPKQAAEIAARIYADVVSGRAKRVATGALVHPGTALDDLVADWIDAITPELGRGTDRTYEVYGRHWCAHFETIGAVTPASIADYQRLRLGSVVRTTIVKERSALRRFLAWLVERGVLAALPEFPTLPKKALGTTGEGRRKAPTMSLTPAETLAVIAALPEWSPRTRKGARFAVRARFEVAYETALRPTTLDLVRWGDVTVAGLHVRAEVDKNRWDRVVPLSDLARAAFKRIGPGDRDELVFGSHDYRSTFRAAAVAALGERGKLVTPYDLKHARVTDWLDAGASVLGVRFLTGTKLALDRYAHASRRSAERVIGGHSGDEAIRKECEGEDLNLHGSYPASTSSSQDPQETPNSQSRETQKRAETRRPVLHSGDRPPLLDAALADALLDAALRGLADRAAAHRAA